MASKLQGVKSFYVAKIEEKEIALRDKIENLRRLQAQRNELNSRGTQNNFIDLLLATYTRIVSLFPYFIIFNLQNAFFDRSPHQTTRSPYKIYN